MPILPETSQKSRTPVAIRLASAQEWLWRLPQPADSRWQRNLRASLRVLLIFFREFGRDSIPLRASALTFIVVLSLVPMLALGTAVLKGLGGGNEARQAAYRLIAQLEIQSRLAAQEQATIYDEELALTPLAKELKSPAMAEEQAALTAHLKKAVDRIFDYVDRTDFVALGAFGVIGLVLAVMVVLGSIESSLNAIWMTESERPLGRRFMDYLALMILLPLAINLALATEATLQSPALLVKTRELLPLTPWLEHALLQVLPLLLVIATFSILYRFLPNTKVRTMPALAGGIFGGIFWLIIQALFIRTQIGVARYNAIYGSFATLPLFLIWLQMGWTIFLAGAEMAFSCQVWKTYRPGPDNLSPVARLALAFNIVDAVYTDFKNRRLTLPANLTEELQQPETIINSILTELVNGGLLRRVEEKETGYAPASPSETMAPTEIVDLILGTDVPPFKGSHLVIEAMQAARQAVARQKIGPGA
ncbi:YihY/virulence factor BrkB family protein [Thiovibrio sp. JS02]